MVLLGTKTDLRDEKGEWTSSYKDGVKLAKRIGAQKYVECSARKDLNSVRVALHEVLKVHFTKNTETNRGARCGISCLKGSESDQSGPGNVCNVTE